MLIHVNGKLVPKEEATTSVFDHGFLYGDGVFEGIRVYSGNIFRFHAHLDRLYESAKTIKLEIPMSREELERATVETVVANDMQDAYIRLVVSRGRGDLGIDPAKCKEGATVVIIVATIELYPEAYYSTGIKLITSSVPRMPTQCLDPRVKSLNYLNNILAKIEARAAGVPEALMLNYQGRVAECTADNIFIVKDGRLITPDLMQGALGGITREAVMDIASEREIPVVETQLGVHDIYNADECFLTGTGAEILPVVCLDDRTIGNGRPGPITLDLLARYRDLRVLDGTKIPRGGGASMSKTARWAAPPAAAPSETSPALE